MRVQRRLAVQVLLAAVVASLLMTVLPTEASRHLAVAIKYTYHRAVPNVTVDGLP